MSSVDQESLQNELKKKRICRFCLCQDPAVLTHIYLRDTRVKSSAPLPIQIMAIASIEVFSNDGMPSYVCSDCIVIFEYCYQFKQMCKKADNLLRQFPLIGKWPNSLEKPSMNQTQTVLNVSPKQNTRTAQIRVQQASRHVGQESLLLPRKILNSDAGAAAEKMENPNSKQIVTQVEKLNDECSTTFLEKIENNDELSVDDIQQLVASEDVAETEFVDMFDLPIVVVNSGNKTTKPKLLNKSSVRILNKDASRENEPRLSLPKIKKGENGNMEIVAEILNIDDNYEEEPDPNNAEPIETNVFPCPHCERIFPLLQLRDIHLKKHARDRKFRCEECEKSFFSKYDLQRHLFTHNGEKPYKCSACNKAFSRTTLLTRHEKTHTDVPKFICIHCERSFISKEDMEKHAERHKINRPYSCKICNKSFAFKQGVDRHEAIHSRQQPYPCQYCDQSFSTTTKLARHLTAHAGLRPYPCKFCSKSYLLSHHLTRHLRSHKNINDPINAISFICSTCNTSFESRDELIRHSKTHANERNLSCPLCKEAFDDMSTLTSHIQDHSDGEAYACEFCDLIFMTGEKLQLHTDIDHIQEMEAYHADDRAQADKKREQIPKEEIEISDEKLQSEVNKFLMDELSDDANDSNNALKRKIKNESENQSPKIINQVIIRSGTEEENNDNKAEDNNGLLIPLKRHKVDIAEKKPVETQEKTQKQSKQSPQLRRRTANATISAKDANLPTIQSLLKMPKSVAIKTASNAEPKPVVIKVENETTPTSSSTNVAENQNIEETVKIKIGDKKVKMQKITVTKAQAAAMAKGGRITIKEGKIILNK